MAKNPSTIWYFNDWENEEGLKLCSLAAQGLWMRMLCIASRASPPGHLRIGRRPVTPAQLAKHVGEKDVEIIKNLLAELRQYGVYSTNKRGTIFSRRMVREGTKKVSHQERGRTGGLAKARKQREKRGSKTLAKPLAKVWQTSSKRLAPLTPGSFASSQDSQSLYEQPSESLNAARASKEESVKTKVVETRDASCARPEGRPHPGEAATLCKDNPADLDLEGQNHDNSQQEPAMGSIHGVSPELAASRTTLGAVAVLGSGSGQRERKRGGRGMAAIGRQRPRPPPCDPIRRDFRRRQQILNLEEWLKTTSLGDPDKQRRAQEVLARAKAALHDPAPAAWKARPFADKQLYDELAALYAAHRPLRRGESPSLERRRQLHEIQFRGCPPPPTTRWRAWDPSVLQGMPPPPRPVLRSSASGAGAA